MTFPRNCLQAWAVALLLSSSAAAGPLASDTNTYGGIWHSSTPFQGYFDYPGNTNPSTLSGHIDWAVYAPGQFPGGFSDYSPDPDEFVYAYQAFIDEGSAPLSFVGVTIQTVANNIGTFTGNGGFGLVTGDDSLFSQFLFDGPNITDANWSFDEIQDMTRGLVFTSPNGPMLLDGRVIDGGSTGDVVPLPTPNPEWVPEPSSLTLASLGLGMFVLRWLRGRKGRVSSSK